MIDQKAVELVDKIDWEVLLTNFLESPLSGQRRFITQSLHLMETMQMLQHLAMDAVE
jgi:hypothetical protein